MHDALTHSFRRFDDSRQLVINTTLKTKAAVDQTALSRSPLEKCIVSLLIRGNFTSPKERFVILEDPKAKEPGKALVWSLDAELSLTSDNLQDAVTVWLREFDGNAAQREASLHLIIRTLEEYVGKTTTDRPKVNVDGKRVQGPTVRVLPTRSAALEHARKEHLLTSEELEAAGWTGAAEATGAEMAA